MSDIMQRDDKHIGANVCTIGQHLDHVPCIPLSYMRVVIAKLKTIRGVRGHRSRAPNSVTARKRIVSEGYIGRGALRRRSGGGPGGGCTRKPVGIPSYPRGGRWKPRSRAMPGTVGG
jgi:hypothetical protein